MRGPEGKIQDAVVKYARGKGLLCKKNEVGRFNVSSGWPDFTIYGPEELCFFIEFKRPGGKLTELQAHVKLTLEQRGFEVYVIDNVNDGRSVIDKECA